MSKEKEVAKDLLLEIGVEELPARFVTPARDALKALCEKAFKDAGLSCGELRTLGTPRRLALLAERVSTKSEDRVIESLGPSLAQAKDKDGNWTPAAQGFARSQGTTPEKLEVRETDRGPRLCAVKKEGGQPAEKILPALLAGLIKQIPFPKNMVWEDSRFSFARPLRWILALYGAAPVKFEVAGIKSGKNTFGLRIHGRKPLPMALPSRYVSLLKDKLVVADPAERRTLVEKQIQQAVKPVKGHVPLDKYADLLEEVTNLVEHPVGLLGSFDPGRLTLPAEMLITSMKKHQKYFPVFDGAGRLLPHFVGVRNGVSENQSVVREGYERVLAARLADADFFFREDRKTSLEDKAPRLKGVLFQKELGTLWDKTERLVKLTARLAGLLNLDDRSTTHAAYVAVLSKADLVSAVVGEFPELQGVMGRIYGHLEGKEPAVSQGLEQHYWPLTADGALPDGPAAAIVSLADKLDTLAGDFLVGLVPTGSQDPYGLRRASIGVLRILEDRDWRLSLPEALDLALSAFPSGVGGDRRKTLQSLVLFFSQRWAALKEAEGFRRDEVQAVAGTAGFADPVDAGLRLQALHEIRRHPDFEPLAVAFKRSANILRQAGQKGFLTGDGAVQESLLKEPAEKDLFSALGSVEPEAAPLFRDGRYADALKGLVRLRRPVDGFFETVMVMAPEESLRSNRLSLVRRVATLFLRVADLSSLQDTPAAHPR